MGIVCILMTMMMVAVEIVCIQMIIIFILMM